MEDCKEYSKRKRIRLKDFDYSNNGAYFITICSYNKEFIFAKIDNTINTSVGQGLCSCRNLANENTENPTVGQRLCSCRNISNTQNNPICTLSPIGEIIKQEIYNLKNRYENVKIEKFIIMPNHIHMIILLDNFTDLRQEQSPCPIISQIICTLKSISTKRANAMNNASGRKIWQFRFYDHIIRNRQGYLKIWEYIDNNVIKWEQDCLYSLE